MAISINEISSEVGIRIDNDIYAVLDYNHVKPGKGGAFVRTKLRSLTSGNVLERTFRSGEKLEDAFIEYKKLQFSYAAGNDYHFMEEKTFEQFQISAEQLGDVTHYLKENMIVNASFYEGKLMSVEAPMFVELKVVEADPEPLAGDRGRAGDGGVPGKSRPSGPDYAFSNIEIIL